VPKKDPSKYVGGPSYREGMAHKLKSKARKKGVELSSIEAHSKFARSEIRGVDTATTPSVRAHAAIASKRARQAGKVFEGRIPPRTNPLGKIRLRERALKLFMKTGKQGWGAAGRAVAKKLPVVGGFIAAAGLASDVHAAYKTAKKAVKKK